MGHFVAGTRPFRALHASRMVDAPFDLVVATSACLGPQITMISRAQYPCMTHQQRVDTSCEQEYAFAVFSLGNSGTFCYCSTACPTSTNTAKQMALLLLTSITTVSKPKRLHSKTLPSSQLRPFTSIKRRFCLVRCKEQSAAFLSRDPHLNLLLASSACSGQSLQSPEPQFAHLWYGKNKDEQMCFGLTRLLCSPNEDAHCVKHELPEPRAGDLRLRHSWRFPLLLVRPWKLCWSFRFVCTT